MEKKSSKLSYDKFTQNEWLMIEQELSSMQMKVCSAMKFLGQMDYDQQARNLYQEKNKYFICGDNLYQTEIQPILSKQFPKLFSLSEPIQTLPSKGKKEKKGGKKDKKGKNQVYEKFLKNQVNEKIKYELSQLIKNIEEKQLYSFFFGFNNTYLEIKLSTFFFIANCLLNQSIAEQEDKEKNKEQFYELIIALQKTISIYKNYTGPYADQQSKIKKNIISQNLLKDLQNLMNLLKKTVCYSITTLAIQYPKLQIFTTYDQFFPVLDIKPYKSQVDFINSLRNLEQSKDPYLIFYKTMIASGKTSATIALASFAMNASIQYQIKPPIQVIFSCGVEPVRHQIGQMAYNSKISFAIMGTFWSAQHQDKIFRIINNWRCANEKYPTLLISDPESTLNYLQQPDSNPNTIVFLDEPLLGHVDAYQEQIKILKDILQATSKRLILCSSTIPSPELLPNLVKQWRERTKCEQGNQISTIQSQEFQLGCQIFSYQGIKFFPHHVCRKKSDLESLIIRIKENGFFHRLYPLSSLYDLHHSLLSKNITNLPNLTELNDITQQTVKQLTFEMLQTLSIQSETIIEQICTPQTSQQDYFSYSRLATSDSYKFPGGCLIVTKDPFQFMKDYFLNYTENCMSLSSIQKIVEGKQKLKEKEEKVIMEKFHKEEDLARELTDLESKYSQLYEFDEKQQINTKFHFISNHKHNPLPQKQYLRQPLFEIEQIITSLSSKVSEEILLLLLCGVGIYKSANNKYLPDEYLKQSLKLASQGKLAYLISDDSLTYGMNFPINNLILTEDIVDDLTMNALFQLMGRVGRVGVSYLANIYFPDLAIKRLSLNLQVNQEELQEAQQIDCFFQ